MATATELANAQATHITTQYRIFAGPTYKSLVAGGLTTTLAGWTAPDTDKPAGWTDITARTNYASDFTYQLRGNSAVWSAQLSGSDYDATYLGIDLAMLAWRRIWSPSSDLMTNGSFETFTGSADDGTSDTFTGWSNSGTDANNRIEATTTKRFGTYAIKLIKASGNPYITSTAITVEASTAYVLDFYARGDGTGNGSYSIYDASNAAAIIGTTRTDVTGTSYTKISVPFTTPAGCTSINLIFGPHESNSATVYFDDVTLYKLGGDWQAWEREFVGQIVNADDRDNYKRGQQWQRTVRGGDSLIERYNAPRLVAGIIDITTGADVTVSMGGELADPSLEAKSGEFIGGLYDASVGNIVDGKPNTVYISDDIPGNNLLANHSFETFTGTANDNTTDTFTSWTNTLPNAGDRVLAVTSLDSYMYRYAHYGISACKIVSNSASTGATIHQDITVIAGTRYLLDFWTRGDGGLVTGYFALYDNSNAAWITTYNSTNITDTAWTQYKSATNVIGHPFVTPVGCTSLRVYFKVNPGGTAYFDDINLHDNAGGTDDDPDGGVIVSEVFFKPTAGFPLAQSWWIEVCSQHGDGGKKTFRLVSMQTWNAGTELYTDTRYCPDDAHYAVFNENIKGLSDGRFGIICANRKIFERMTGGAPNAEFVIDASDYAPNFSLSPTDGFVGIVGGDSRSTIIWAPGGAERYGRSATDTEDHWSTAETDPEPWYQKEHTFDSDALPEFCGHSIRRTLDFFGGEHCAGDPTWFFKNEYPSPGRYTIDNVTTAIKVSLRENFSYLLDATDTNTTAIQLDNYLGWLPATVSGPYKGVVESDVFTYTAKEASALTGVTWDGAGTHVHAKDARVQPYDKIYYNGASSYAAQTGYPVDYAKLYRRKPPYIESFEVYWSYLDGDGALDYQDSGWRATYNYGAHYFDGGNRAEYIIPFYDTYHNVFSWVRTVLLIVKRMADSGRTKLNEFIAHPYMLGMNASGVPSVNTAQSYELTWYLLNTYLGYDANDFSNAATDSEHYLGSYALALTSLTSVFDDLARKTGCIVDYNPDGKVYWRTDPWWPLRDAITPEAFTTSYVRGDILLTNEARTIDAVIVNAMVVGSTEPHSYRAVMPPPIPPSTEPPTGSRVEEINDVVVANDSDVRLVAEMEYAKRIRTGKMTLTVTGIATWLRPGMLVALSYDYDGSGEITRSYEIENITRRRGITSGNATLTDSVTLRRFI